MRRRSSTKRWRWQRRRSRSCSRRRHRPTSTWRSATTPASAPPPTKSSSAGKITCRRGSLPAKTVRCLLSPARMALKQSLWKNSRKNPQKESPERIPRKNPQKCLYSRKINHATKPTQSLWDVVSSLRLITDDPSGVMEILSKITTPKLLRQDRLQTFWISWDRQKLGKIIYLYLCIDEWIQTSLCLMTEILTFKTEFSHSKLNSNQPTPVTMCENWIVLLNCIAM